MEGSRWDGELGIRNWELGFWNWVISGCRDLVTELEFSFWGFWNLGFVFWDLKKLGIYAPAATPCLQFELFYLSSVNDCITLVINGSSLPNDCI